VGAVVNVICANWVLLAVMAVVVMAEKFGFPVAGAVTALEARLSPAPTNPLELVSVCQLGDVNGVSFARVKGSEKVVMHHPI